MLLKMAAKQDQLSRKEGNDPEKQKITLALDQVIFQVLFQGPT
jgi:hypothetical protein